MNEINLSKIRGKWEERKKCDYCKTNERFACSNDIVAGGDDTIESIKMVAEKVNELIKDYQYIRSLVLPLE